MPECTSAKKMFMRKENGLKHVIRHAIDNKCPLCGENTDSLILTKHLETHKELFPNKPISTITGEA